MVTWDNPKRKIGLPKTVRCGRYDWKVIECRTLAVDGSPRAGLCDFTNRRIYVSIESEPWETLIHEMIHAELSSSGINCTSISSDLQEIFCESISRAIVENLKVSARKKGGKSR